FLSLRGSVYPRYLHSFPTRRSSDLNSSNINKHFITLMKIRSNFVVMNAISSKYNLVKIYELDFGNIEVYSNLIVGIVNDGIDFNLEHISALINIAEIHFSKRNFGYI